MKNTIRNVIAFIFLSPILMIVLISTIFWGKRGAIRFWGPLLTFFSKLYIMALVPNVRNATEFNDFKSKLKSRLWLCKPFFDVRIAFEDKDTIKLDVSNCPFCEALQNSGLKEMAPYICEADWKLAKQRREQWKFERTCQIGTGDTCCDTTYKRILVAPNEAGL
jgi:hypothetical protein